MSASHRGRSLPSFAKPAAVCLLIVLLGMRAADNAEANGGQTIAAAPNLSLGATVTGGGTAGGTEFWRIPLRSGDGVTIDFQSINGGCVRLNLYDPSVTDATLGSSSSVTNGEACSAPSQLAWTATGKGSWILQVQSDHGYKLTARVTTKSLGQAAAKSTISGAAAIPFGRSFVDNAGFWRIPLAKGDALKIDFQPVNGGCVRLYIYAPSVSDASLGSASSVSSGEACSGQSQLAWTATGRGSWILQVLSDHGYRLEANAPGHKSTPAHAAHATAVAAHCSLLQATVRVGQIAHGRCVISGVPAKTNAAIQYRARGGWATAAKGPTGKGGLFVFSLHSGVRETFDLWLLVSPTHGKPVRTHIGSLHVK